METVQIFRIARDFDMWRGLYSTGAFSRIANSLNLWRDGFDIHPMPYEDLELKDYNVREDDYFGFGSVNQLLSWVYLRKDVFREMHCDGLCLYKFKSDAARVGVTQAIFKRGTQREVEKISLLDFEKSLDKNLLQSYIDKVIAMTKEPERV